MLPSDCLDCQHLEYCEHTSMDYCKLKMAPAWMVHSDFYDHELDACSKRQPCISNRQDPNQNTPREE